MLSLMPVLPPKSPINSVHSSLKSQLDFKELNIF